MKDILMDAIREYNKYRYPEIEANIVDIKDNTFVVEFFGYLCRSCGLYDHFEDLIYILEEKGIKAEIKDVKRFIVEENDRINVVYLVEYKIKDD